VWNSALGPEGAGGALGEIVGAALVIVAAPLDVMGAGESVFGWSFWHAVTTASAMTREVRMARI
jgi:hypothetical protein